MICILSSAQLCDTLYPNIIENNKPAVEYAHRCVYYLSSSTFHRESVCLLSESKSQITAVSPSILTRYECKTRCLEQYPTLVGTTDGLKHHPPCTLNETESLVWSLVTLRSIISVRRSNECLFPEMAANGASKHANSNKFGIQATQ